MKVIDPVADQCRVWTYVSWVMHCIKKRAFINLWWSSGHDFRLSFGEISNLDKRGRPGFDSVSD